MKYLDCPNLILFLAVGRRDARVGFRCSSLQLCSWEIHQNTVKSLFRSNTDWGKGVWLVSVRHLGHNFPFHLQTQQGSPTWMWPTLCRAEFGPDSWRLPFRSDDAHEVGRLRTLHPGEESTTSLPIRCNSLRSSLSRQEGHPMFPAPGHGMPTAQSVADGKAGCGVKPTPLDALAPPGKSVVAEDRQTYPIYRFKWNPNIPATRAENPCKCLTLLCFPSVVQLQEGSQLLPFFLCFFFFF